MSRLFVLAVWLLLFIRKMMAITVPKPLSVEPLTLASGTMTVFKFSFTPEMQINNNPSFMITFPPQFKSVSDSLGCYVKKGSGNYISQFCSKSQNTQIEISIPQTLIEIVPYEISIWEIKNPDDSFSSANFKIGTYSFGALIEQSEEFEGIPFLEKPSLFKTLSFSSIGQPKASNYASFTLIFQTLGNIALGQKLLVTFPRDFSTKNSSCIYIDSSNQDVIISKGITAGDRGIICENLPSQLSAVTNNYFKIVDVRFPFYSVSTDKIFISVLDSNGINTLAQSMISNSINSVPNPVQLSVIPTFVYVSTYSKFELDFSVYKTISYPQVLKIELSNTWSSLSSECTVKSGLKVNSGKINCIKDFSSNSYTIDNFLETDLSNIVKIEFSAKAPSIAENSQISFSSFDLGLNTTIDQGIAFVEIKAGVIYSQDAFAVNVEQLKPNDLFEIELILNLQTKLTSTTGGDKIVLNIFPQITSPEIDSNTELKCSFLTKLASSCIFDNSNPNKSVLTINTPLGTQVKNTQIKITTIDKILKDPIGLNLPDIGKRYLFQISSFLENSVNPSEVFHSQFAPQSLILQELTLKAFGNAANDETQLEINLKIPLKLNYPKRKYYISIEFLSTNNAWADALGYSLLANNGGVNTFPCISLSKFIIYKCILMKKDGISVIRVNNNEDWNDGDLVSIFLPGVKIGTLLNVDAFVKVNIVEETPSPLDYYLDPFIVYSSTVKALTSTTSAIIPTTPINLETTANLIDPSGNGIEMISYTVNTENSNIIVYDLGYDQSRNTVITCSGNHKCFILEKPFNKLVFIRNLLNTTGFTHSLNLPSNTLKAPLISQNIISISRVYGGVNGIELKQKNQLSFNFQYSIIPQDILIDEPVLLNSPKIITAQFQLPKFVSKTPGCVYLKLTNIDVSNYYPIHCVYSNNLIPSAASNGVVDCQAINSTTFRIKNFNFLENYAGQTTIEFMGKVQNSIIAFSVDSYVGGNCDSKRSSSIPKEKTVALKPEAVVDLFEVKTSFSSPIVKGEKAPLKFSLQPRTSQASKVKLTFPSNFNLVDLTQQFCKLNEIAISCSITSSPLTITFDYLVFLPNSLLNFYFSTGLVNNEQGIDYNVDSKVYPILIELLNSTNDVKETQTTFILVLPPKLKTFEMVSLANNQGSSDNIIEISFSSDSLIPSSEDLIDKGTITIEFDTSNSFFSSSLVSGKKTGDSLPCFSNITPISGKKILCKLISATSTNKTALIKIINFDTIASNSISKVYFGNLQVMATYTNNNVNVGVWIGLINVASNLKSYSNYQGTSLSIYTSSISLTPISQIYSAPLKFTGDKKIGDTNVELALKVDSPVSGWKSGDRIILKIPNTLTGLSDSFDCSVFGSNIESCYVLLDSNTLVIKLSSSITATEAIALNIGGLNGFSYVPSDKQVITTLSVQNGVITEQRSHNYELTELAQLAGAITNINFEPLGSGISDFTLPMSRNKIWVKLSFDLQFGVPEDGIIEIKAAGLRKVFGGCYSLARLSSPSSLQSKHGTSHVGCSSDGATTLTISSFQELVAGSTVKLMILADTDVKDLNISIATYKDSTKANLINLLNSFIISKRSSIGINAESSLTYIQYNLLRVNSKGPIEFSFSPSASLVTRIILIFPSSSMSPGTASTFGLSGKKFGCKLTKDSVIYSCETSSTANQINLDFGTPLTNDLYTISIKTIDDDDETNSGIQFPSNEGLYEILTESYRLNSGSYEKIEKSSLLLQVYPPDFQSFTLTSLNSKKLADNIFNLRFIPGTQISNSDKLVISLNVQNVGTNDLFATKTLGRKISLNSVSNHVDKCFLYSGFNANEAAQTIICNFKAIANSGDEIEIFFNLKNVNVTEELSYRYSVPVYACILDSNGIKKIFNYKEAGYYIQQLDSTSKNTTEPMTLSSLGLGSNTILTFKHDCSFSLNAGDFILLKLGFASDLSGNYLCSPNTLCTVYAFNDVQILILKIGEILLPTSPIAFSTLTIPNGLIERTASERTCISLSQNKYESLNDRSTISQFTVSTPQNFDFIFTTQQVYQNSNSDYKLQIRGNYAGVSMVLIKFSSVTSFNHANCIESFDSQIPIRSCTLELIEGIVIMKVFLVINNYSSSMYLRVNTLYNAFVNPADVSVFNINLYFYQNDNGEIPKINVLPLGLMWQVENYSVSSTFINTNGVNPGFLEIVDKDYESYEMNITSADPGCCSWLRFDLIGGGAGGGQDSFIQVLLDETHFQITGETDFGEFKNNKPLCFINDTFYPCTFISGQGTKVAMFNISTEGLVFNDKKTSFAIAFSNLAGDYVNGFTLQDNKYSFVTVVFSGTFGYVSGFYPLKPKLIPKFELSNYLTQTIGIRNAFEFNLNLNWIIGNGKDFMIQLEVEGTPGTVFYTEDIPVGGSIPCNLNSQFTNLASPLQCNLFYIKNINGVKLRYLIKGTAPSDLTQDFKLSLWGIKNPFSVDSELSFYISVFEENVDFTLYKSYKFAGYQELNKAFKTKAGSIISNPMKKISPTKAYYNDLATYSFVLDLNLDTSDYLLFSIDIDGNVANFPCTFSSQAGAVLTVSDKLIKLNAKKGTLFTAGNVFALDMLNCVEASLENKIKVTVYKGDKSTVYEIPLSLETNLQTIFNLINSIPMDSTDLTFRSSIASTEFYQFSTYSILSFYFSDNFINNKFPYKGKIKKGMLASISFNLSVTPYDSINACTVYGGFTNSLVQNQVGCDVVGNKFFIRNFEDFLGSGNKVLHLFLIVNNKSPQNLITNPSSDDKTLRFEFFYSINSNILFYYFNVPGSQISYTSFSLNQYIVKHTGIDAFFSKDEMLNNVYILNMDYTLDSSLFIDNIGVAFTLDSKFFGINLDMTVAHTLKLKVLTNGIADLDCTQSDVTFTCYTDAADLPFYSGNKIQFQFFMNFTSGYTFPEPNHHFLRVRMTFNGNSIEHQSINCFLRKVSADGINADAGYIAREQSKYNMMHITANDQAVKEKFGAILVNFKNNSYFNVSSNEDGETSEKYPCICLPTNPGFCYIHYKKPDSINTNPFQPSSSYKYTTIVLYISNPNLPIDCRFPFKTSTFNDISMTFQQIASPEYSKTYNSFIGLKDFNVSIPELLSLSGLLSSTITLIAYTDIPNKQFDLNFNYAGAGGGTKDGGYVIFDFGKNLVSKEDTNILCQDFYTGECFFFNEGFTVLIGKQKTAGNSVFIFKSTNSFFSPSVTFEVTYFDIDKKMVSTNTEIGLSDKTPIDILKARNMEILGDIGLVNGVLVPYVLNLYYLSIDLGLFTVAKGKSIKIKYLSETDDYNATSLAFSPPKSCIAKPIDYFSLLDNPVICKNSGGNDFELFRLDSGFSSVGQKVQFFLYMDMPNNKTALPYPDGGMKFRRDFFPNKIPESVTLRGFSPSRIKNSKASFRARFMITEPSKFVEITFSNFYKSSSLPGDKSIVCKLIKYLVNSNIYMSPDSILEVPCTITMNSTNNYYIRASNMMNIIDHTTYEFTAMFIDNSVNSQNINPPSRYYGFYQILEFVTNNVLYTQIKVTKPDNSIISYLSVKDQVKSSSDLFMTGYSITSKVSSEVKTLKISFKVLELLTSYPNSIIEVQFSARKPGDKTIWNFNASLFSPSVGNGQEASCYIAKNLLNNSGTQVNVAGRAKAKCLYYFGIANDQPAIVRFVDFGDFIGTDEITLIIENLVGPNTNSGAFTLKVVKDINKVSQKTFVLYNQYLFGVLKNINSDVLDNGVSFVINNPAHNEYGASGVIMEYTLGIDYGTYNGGDKFELKLSKFLSSVTANIENIAIALAGQNLNIIYRNPVSKTVLAVVPAGITLNANSGTKISLSNIQNPLSTPSSSSDLVISYRIYRNYDLAIEVANGASNSLSTASSAMDLTVNNIGVHKDGMYKLTMVLGSPFSLDTFNTIKITVQSDSMTFKKCLSLSGGIASSLNERACIVGSKSSESYLLINGIYGTGITINVLASFKSNPSIIMNVILFDSGNNILFNINKTQAFTLDSTLSTASTIDLNIKTNHGIQKALKKEFRNVGDQGEIVFTFTTKVELNSTSSILLSPFIPNEDMLNLGSPGILKCLLQVYDTVNRYYKSPFDTFECKFDANGGKEIEIKGIAPTIQANSLIKIRIQKMNSLITIPMTQCKFLLSYADVYKDTLEFNPLGKEFVSVKSESISNIANERNFIKFNLKVPQAISQYLKNGKETNIEISFDSFDNGNDLGAKSNFGINNGEPFFSKKSSTCVELEKNLIIFGDSISSPKILHYLLSDFTDLANPISFLIPNVINPVANKQIMYSVRILQFDSNTLIPAVLFYKDYLSSKVIKAGTIDNVPISSLNIGSPVINTNSQIQFTFNNPVFIDRAAAFSGIALSINGASDTLNQSSICSFEAKKSGSESYLFEYYSAKDKNILVERSSLNLATGTNSLSQVSPSQLSYLSIPGDITIDFFTYSNGALTSKRSSNTASVNSITNNFDVAVTKLINTIGFTNLNNRGVYDLVIKANYDIPKQTKLEISFPIELISTQSIIFNPEICPKIIGLTAKANSIITCVKTENTKFVVSGYETIASGTIITISIYLRISMAGVNIKPTISIIYESNQKIFSLINPQIGISTGPVNAPLSEEYSMEKVMYILPNAKNDFDFVLNTKDQPATFLPTDIYNVIVELPSDFTIEAGSIISGFYNVKGQTSWVNIPNTVLSTIPTGLKFKMSLPVGQYLNKENYYEFMISCKNNGIKSLTFPDAGKYVIAISTEYGGSLKEVGEYILDLQNQEPASGLIKFLPFTIQALELTYTKVEITPSVDLEIGDQIWIEFPMKNSFGVALFEEDLGTGAADTFSKIYCSEAFGAKNISDNPIGCILSKGNALQNYPATLRLTTSKRITIGNTFSFIFGKIKNPAISEGLVSIKLTIKRKKVGLNILDNIVSKTIIYLTGSQWVANYVNKNSVSDAIGLNVSTVSELSKHSYNLQFSQTLSIGSYLIFEYPADISKLPSVCSFGTHNCLVVIEQRNIIVQLSSQIASGSSSTYQLELQNGIFSPDPISSSLYKIKLQAITGNNIKDAFQFNSPTYTPLSGILIEALETQTANGDNGYFMKGTNQAHFKLSNILESDFIKGIWIQGSLDFQKFDGVYCNATIDTPELYRPSVYPPKFDCQLQSDTLLQLAFSAENNIRNYTFDKTISSGLVINLYVSFIIPSTTPQNKFSISVSGVAQLGKSSSRIVSSKEFQISSNVMSTQSSIQLTKKAYIDSNQLSLSFSIKPTINSSIVKIEISLPNEFVVNFTGIKNFAQCSLQTNSAIISITQCTANSAVNNGRNITVIASGYNNEEGTLEISGLNMIYILPNIPSSSLLAGIKYTAFDSTSESIIVKFNPIIGRSLVNIKANFGGDIETMSKLDIIFDTDANKIGKGYISNTELSYSQIYISFSKSDGYTNDLGTGVANNDKLGCIGISGISVSNGNSLECRLKLGNTTNDPEILITGFDEIPANSKAIQLSISKIKTTSLSISTSFRIGVRKYTVGNSLPSISHEFSIVRLQASTTPAFTSAISLPVSVNGFTIVGGINEFIFGVNTLNILKAGDFINLKLDKELIWVDSPLIAITTVPPTDVYLYKDSYNLYFKVQQDFTQNAFNFQIKGVPGVPYSVSGTFNAAIQTIQNTKIVDNFIYSISQNTQPKAVTKFVATINDQSLGMINTFINFNIKLGFLNNPFGSLKIQFSDMSFGNFTEINAICLLIGVDTLASCSVKANSIEIYFNGLPLNTNDEMNITLKNLINPLVAPVSQNIELFCYFDSSQTKVTAHSILSYPSLISLDKHKCNFNTVIGIQTSNSFSDYIFQLNCTKSLLDKSSVSITFPSPFVSRNTELAYECSAVNVGTLSNLCKAITRNISSTVQVLDIIFDLSGVIPLLFDLKVQLFRNGPAGSHSITNSMLYNGITYGDTSNSILTFQEAGGESVVGTNPIVFNINQDISSSSAKAIYKIGLRIPLSTNNVKDFKIIFPLTYPVNLGGNTLKCYYSRLPSALGSIIHKQYLPLISASSQINCTRLANRQILISNVTSIFATQGDVVFFVSKIQNPMKSENSVIFKGELMKTDTLGWISFTSGMVSTFSSVPRPFVLNAISSSNNKNFRLANVSLTYKPKYDYSGSSSFYVDLDETVFGLNNDKNIITCTSSLASFEVCKKYGLTLQTNDTVSITNLKAINFGILNIQNPMEPLTCPLTGIPVNLFRSKMVDDSNTISYKTFSHLNVRNNCINYVVEKFKINVTGPTDLQAGKSYNYTASLEFGSSNLIIQTSSNDSTLASLQTQVTFNDSTVQQKQFGISLANNSSPQIVSFRFAVTDPSNNYATTVNPLTLNISATPVETTNSTTNSTNNGTDNSTGGSNNTGNSSIPDNTTNSTNGNTTSNDTSGSNSSNSTNSSSGSNSTNSSTPTSNSSNPSGVSAIVQTKDVIIYYQAPDNLYKNGVPNYIRFYTNDSINEVARIRFTQNCENELGINVQFIDLTPSQISNSIEVSINPKTADKTCVIYLTAENPFSTNLSKVNNFILNRERIYIDIKSNIITGAKPIVEWVQVIEVKKNTGLFKVQVDTSSYINYTIARKSSVTPTLEQLHFRTYEWAEIYGTSGTYQYGTKFQSDIFVDSLVAGQQYVLYLVANTSAETSEISTTQFSTQVLSDGVVFKMFFNDNAVNISKVRKTISDILRVPEDRIKNIFADSMIIDEPGNPPNISKAIRFVISPDIRNDNLTLEDVKKLSSPDAQLQFGYSFTDSYVSSALVEYFKYKLPMPLFVQIPTIIKFSYYSLSYNVSLDKPGQVFALRIPRAKRDRPLYDKPPTGMQILNGFDQDNSVLPTKYYTARIRLQEYEVGTLSFNDMMENTVFDIYFVIANDKIYDPPDFSEEKPYIVQFSTVINDNTIG